MIRRKLYFSNGEEQTIEEGRAGGGVGGGITSTESTVTGIITTFYAKWVLLCVNVECTSLKCDCVL